MSGLCHRWSSRREDLPPARIRAGLSKKAVYNCPMGFEPGWMERVRRFGDNRPVFIRRSIGASDLFAVASVLQISLAVFWDHMSAGILMGGFWVRLGCVFNGCCVGRQTSGWFGVRLHDTRSIGKRRIPVQLMEMAWWLLGWAWFIWLWPRSLAPGSYAIGVLGWYGLGRFWLEPLREMPDLVLGRVRINQVVAGALAIAGARRWRLRVRALLFSEAWRTETPAVRYTLNTRFAAEPATTCFG